MLELLHRTSEERPVADPEHATGTVPPEHVPRDERRFRPRWPRRAKLAVAGLAVVAVAGAFGSAAQLATDDVDVSEYEARIAIVTEQRDEARAENEALTTDIAALDTDNVQIRAELDVAAMELASERLDNTTLSSDLASATARIDDLTASVGDLQAANETVSAERDALVATFPMIVDTSLVDVDVTGVYTTRWFPAYNSGLADIPLPSVAQVTITRTAQGWLHVDIPGVVSADLARTDGALFTMIDTTTAVPPLDGKARTARVAITIYAGETNTASDGTTTVTELGLSIAISTPEVGDAPAGIALYGAVLTPQR